MLATFYKLGSSDALKLLKLANRKLHERRVWRGLKISIENRQGSRRYWKDPNSGDEGSTYMHYPYGYIRLTEGSDGDHIDVYLGPNKNAKNVYIVNQMKKPEGSVKGDGKRWSQYDEQKCMLGFNSAAEAKKAYIKQYDDARFFGSIVTLPFETFKIKALRSLVGGRHKIALDVEPISEPERCIETSSLLGLRRAYSPGATTEDTIDRAFGPEQDATGGTAPAISLNRGSERSL